MSSSPPTNPVPRRGLPKWLKVSIIVLLVLANVAAIGLIWAIRTGNGILALANTDQDVVDELSAATGDALTFLIVGSDSRQGLDDLTNFGSAGGQRGDVIMLVRLDRSSGEAKILSIPRDLWVDIPGNGKGKINAAYAYGGPSLMVQTIRENLGISVNHYVEIGFVGFIAMVDQLGGIEMTFPYPARDVSSGLDVSAGTQVLDGRTALAFARSRKYQEYQNGKWVSVDASDIGRTQRQQQVVRAILSELKSPSSVTEAGQIAGAMAEHMIIDASLADSSVAGLAWDFRSLLRGNLDGTTLPVDGASIGGASVVVRREPDATEAIQAFLAGSQETATAPLRLQVLNGNGVSGAAGHMAERLSAEGYEVASVGDAPNKDYQTTTVIIRSGSDAGQAIVQRLGFGVVEVGSVDNAYDAVVIVGADAT
ncbi:MAG: LCP family protein [Acidimicrobiia bacterium]